jgi:hypothetical protein
LACGLGWAEYLACEEDCHLESDAAARKRKKK